MQSWWPPVACRGEATNRRHENTKVVASASWCVHWLLTLGRRAWACCYRHAGIWFWFWRTCLSVSRRSDQIDAPVDSVHLKLPEPQLLSLATYSFPPLSTGWTFQRLVCSVILVATDTPQMSTSRISTRTPLNFYLFPSKTKNQQTTFTTTVCWPTKSQRQHLITYKQRERARERRVVASTRI